MERLVMFSCLGQDLRLNSKLSDIQAEIDDSVDIPQLKDGWGDSGKRIPEIVYNFAVTLLSSYSTYILETFNTVINAPEINPVGNGSVDLLWDTSNGYLLINIKCGFETDQILASFCGFQKSNKVSKEGWLNVLNIETEMALWMKNILSVIT